MEQVSPGVVAPDGVAPLCVDRGRRLFSSLEIAVGHVAEMARQPVDDRSRVEYAKDSGGCDDLTGVADLAAALGIERRAVEEDLEQRLPRWRLLAIDVLEVVGDSTREDGDDPGIGDAVGVSEELRRPMLGAQRPPRFRGLLRGGRPELRGLLGAKPLLGHLPLKTLLVNPNPPLPGDLDGDLDRKAERVVQPERHIARDRCGAFGELCFEQRHALAQCAEEGLLLVHGDLLDTVDPRDQLRVGTAHRLYDGVDEIRHDEALAPELVRPEHSSADEAPQHISAAFVRWEDAVGDEERESPRVVADDAQARLGT